MRCGRLCVRREGLNCDVNRVGAHARFLELRSWLARGISNRVVAVDRLCGTKISAEIQGSLNSLISESGAPAYRSVFGTNPVDLFGRGDKGEDMLFAQDTSNSGQFAQQ